MPSREEIRHIRRHDLDTAAWNACIDKAGNGLVYAYSHYLDEMAEQWDALVMGEYQAVMPLPWRKKFGICYLFQPPLTAQLGIFGNHISAGMVQAFLDAVPPVFRYWDLSLNHSNLFTGTGYPLFERMNFVLGLNHSYEQLSGGYRKNIIRNMKKAVASGCRFEKNIPVRDIINLVRQNPMGLTDTGLQRFEHLYGKMQERRAALTCAVFSGSGELLASCVFFFSHGRAYYILVGNHPNGRTLGASHMLLDGFIRDHAGQELTLDFEGSDYHNLAFFYSSFGAVPEKYAAIRLNRLPALLRWLKK